MALQRRRSAVRPRADETLLTKRRLPVQDRARKSVDLILDAAVHLLDEAGLDAFNTNTLAARAGVRVRTVYRYFPNKLAVIIAVAERMAAEWDGWLAGFDELADPRSDWRRLWSDYVDRFVEGIRAAPGGIAIRRAMRALPELQAVDRRDNDHLARQLTSALQRRGVGLPRRRLKPIASLLIESAVAVLDSALLQAPGDSRALVAELKAMQVAYLESNVFGSR